MYDEAQIKQDYDAYVLHCLAYGSHPESFASYRHDWIETYEAAERCKNDPTCCVKDKV